MADISDSFPRRLPAKSPAVTLLPSIVRFCLPDRLLRRKYVFSVFETLDCFQIACKDKQSSNCVQIEINQVDQILCRPTIWNRGNSYFTRIFKRVYDFNLKARVILKKAKSWCCNIRLSMHEFLLTRNKLRLIILFIKQFEP